jgi:hypothetical protein
MCHHRRNNLFRLEQLTMLIELAGEDHGSYGKSGAAYRCHGLTRFVTLL